MKRGKPTRKKGQPGPSSSDVKLPKLPKIQMPEDFKMRTQPLFSLPMEILKLPPPPNKATKSQVSKGGGPRRRSSGKFLLLLLFSILNLTALNSHPAHDKYNKSQRHNIINLHKYAKFK